MVDSDKEDETSMLMTQDVSVMNVTYTSEVIIKNDYGDGDGDEDGNEDDIDEHFEEAESGPESEEASSSSS